MVLELFGNTSLLRLNNIFYRINISLHLMLPARLEQA